MKRAGKVTDDESVVAVSRGSQSARSMVNGRSARGLNVDELADEEDRTEPKSVLLVAFLQLFLIGYGRID